LINRLVKFFSGKEIIFFNPHRCSTPLLTDANKRKYIFLNPALLWKATGLLGAKSSSRYRAMGFLLNIVSPRYIIDINWIARIQTLYFVWCKNHGRKFVVVQHGSYVAGIITDKPHRIAHCHIFLAWSNYFKATLEQYNQGKKLSCIVWGNTVYNQYNRNAFAYKPDTGNKILVAPSLITGERQEVYKQLLEKLKDLGFDVTVKEHLYQATRSVPFEGFPKIAGNIFTVLMAQQFDIVITDVSSTMSDIVFFKTRAVFCSPAGDEDFYINNQYSKYMHNLAFAINELKRKDDFYRYINIEAQEELLKCMVAVGHNNNFDKLTSDNK
jgi:hypothetical protein